MASVALFICLECRARTKLDIELDRRMFARYPEGVHLHCQPCGRYQRMVPEPNAAEAA